MKILVVDDHTLVRQGLAALLSGEDPTTEVLHAGNLAEGLARVEAHRDLDAVLMDLKLPDGDGMAGIGEIGRRRADLPVVILSSSEDPDDVRRALDLGALGYVPKSASPETLISAVRMVLDGGIYVPPLMLDPQAGPRFTGPMAALTPRQIEVLAALARGLSNKEIGLKFGLSEKTVKAHVGAIFRTLSVANRTQAASAAMAAGLIPPRAAQPAQHSDE
jgi:DNA-binding NarL/FixJ family response regulator